MDHITDPLTGEMVPYAYMSQTEILIALHYADIELDCAYDTETINAAAAEMDRLIALLLPCNYRECYRFEQ